LKAMRTVYVTYFSSSLHLDAQTNAMNAAAAATTRTITTNTIWSVDTAGSDFLIGSGVTVVCGRGKVV
jgi:hypothetical protein